MQSAILVMFGGPGGGDFGSGTQNFLWPIKTVLLTYICKRIYFIFASH